MHKNTIFTPLCGRGPQLEVLNMVRNNLPILNQGFNLTVGQYKQIKLRF